MVEVKPAEEDKVYQRIRVLVRDIFVYAIQTSVGVL